MGFFSLGICVHNEAESISRMLNSVFGSNAWKTNDGKREIVICANGCTDNSVEIIKQIQTKHPEIKLIESPVKSKNAAWNLVVFAVNPQAENLFFADADVLIKRKSFDILENALRKNHGLQIVGGQVIPTVANIKAKDFYSRDVAAFSKILRDAGAKTLMGGFYAIRTSAARGLKMPEDPRIMDDQFLALHFKGKWSIVPKAIFYARFPDFNNPKKSTAFRQWFKRGFLSVDGIRHPSFTA